MTKTQPKNTKPTKTRKKQSNAHGRAPKPVMDVNDENVYSTGPSKQNRRSSRLNGATPNATANVEPVGGQGNVPLARRKPANEQGCDPPRRRSLSTDVGSEVADDDGGEGDLAPATKKPKMYSTNAAGGSHDSLGRGGAKGGRGRTAANVEGKGAENANMATAKHSYKAPTIEDRHNQWDPSRGSEEIQELRRQLREEKGGSLHSVLTKVF